MEMVHRVNPHIGLKHGRRVLYGASYHRIEISENKFTELDNDPLDVGPYGFKSFILQGRRIQNQQDEDIAQKIITEHRMWWRMMVIFNDRIEEVKYALRTAGSTGKRHHIHESLIGQLARSISNCPNSSTYRTLIAFHADDDGMAILRLLLGEHTCFVAMRGETI